METICIKRIYNETIAVCCFENILCEYCGKFKGNRVRENKTVLFNNGAKIV